MSDGKQPRMSLLAQFDDLYRTMANMHDDELLPVMVDVFENQEACRLRWQAAEQRVSELTKENDLLKAANLELQADLRHARAVLDDEHRKRISIEACTEALQLQLQQVHQIVSQCGSRGLGGHMVRVLEKVLSEKNLANVNADGSVGSVLSPSGSEGGSLRVAGRASGVEREGQTSAQEAFRYHRRRHSTPGTVASPPSPTATTQHMRQSLGTPARVHFELGDSRQGDCGRKKVDVAAVQGGCGVFAATMTMVSGDPGYVATVASQKKPPCHASPCQQQRSRRSFSGPVSSPQQPPATSTLDRSVVEEEAKFVTGAEQLGPERRSTPVQTEDGSTSQQQHAFVVQLAASSDDCVACGKHIRFYRSCLRCLGCRAVCHPECKGLLPLLCTSGASPVQAKSDRTTTTTTTVGIQRGTVSEYAPSRPPMVPPLVAHCIQEVDRRMGTEKGPLYGRDAPADQVDSLLAQYLVHRHLPPLGDCSTPVVCSLLLKFLASLRETLVTKSSWPFFAKAAECDVPEERLWSLLGAMRGLPAPNLDTLSALLRHLHRVADTSLGGDGRSLEELASLFAPLLVGCSAGQPSAEVKAQDGTTQDLIMLRLLAVPSEYWVQPAPDARGTDEPLYQAPPEPSSELFGPIMPQSTRGRRRSAGPDFLEPRFRK